MLKVENLTISYPDEMSPLIKGQDFEIPKGSICLILGNSGSGKTTLCLALAGLLLHARPETTVSGFIEWNKKLINQKDFNSRIAITLENPYSQLTGLKNNVWEEIAFGLEMRGVPREEIKQRIQKAADTFRISHLLLRHPRTLSGGETQKVVIISSYVLMPELWILDRPLTELDPLARYNFLQELNLLANQKGVTIILTEEPAPDLYSIATHILTITGDKLDLSLNAKKRDIPSADIPHFSSTIEFTKTKNELLEKDLTNHPLVEVKELSFRYSSDQPIILKNLNIVVNPGECLWITGPNGCGKTTLAKIIAGILEPKKGEVYVNGVNNSSNPIWKVAKRAAYAFQDPDLQFFSSDVWSEVSFGPNALSYPKDKCKALSEHALHMFGLDGKEKHQPHDLNRSERRRLGLASVFAMDTPIIILDEPTLYQDSYHKEIIKKAMNNALEKRKTILCITHDTKFYKMMELP